MKRTYFIVAFLFCLTSSYSQIKVSVKHIEEENSLVLSILNTGTDTILISDSHRNRLSMVKISLYSQDNSEPCETWCTLGTNQEPKALPIIELAPNKVNNHTYRKLSSWKKGPYNKIELYYDLVYRLGSLINSTPEHKSLRGTITPN